MEETYTISDGRSQTAIVMAKAEIWKLRGWLESRARQLRAEADAIEEMLNKCSEQTDSWYETIVREATDARRRALDLAPAPQGRRIDA